MQQSITVKSPANIAFIKYWGQLDSKLVMPYNDSFSMNLSNCYTTLKVDFHDDPKNRELLIKDYKAKEFKPASADQLKKVIEYYEVVKKYYHSKRDLGYTIYSENSFPKKAGIASSASFYSALAYAFAWILSSTEPTKEDLSILARLSGSGSACRSIPDGFVWWYKGNATENSFAESIASPNHWDLVDVVLILSLEEKKVGSQEGHKGVETSSFFADRLLSVSDRLNNIKRAFEEKNFERFGKILEDEALSMHTVMMSQNPPLYFWSGKTIEIIKKLIELRNNGVAAYYTIDAGENVHIICEKKNEKKVVAYFEKQPEVEEIIVNYPAEGTREVKESNT